jgi:GNAT superfamily N-acetyltransferase
MEIRPARPGDLDAVVRLIRALAEFEKLPPPPPEAEERLRAAAFDPPRRLELWVAEREREVVAYAACFETYSTFRLRPTLFLEDLFVHPGARRTGVATAMLAHLRAEAERRGCGRFEWMVLDWNADAQKLYQGVGARMMTDWRLMRIDLPG